LKTENLPQEGKDYLKLKAQLTEERTRGLRRLKETDTELNRYRKDALRPKAESLAAEHGVDIEDLLKLPDEDSMIVHAYKHRNPDKIKAPEVPQETKTQPEPVVETKNDRPSVAAGEVRGGNFRTIEDRFSKGEVSLDEYSAARKAEGIF
jgi:hypothetical protein